MNVELNGNVTTEYGLYWAKSDNHKWFNLIVQVGAEPPFLSIAKVMNLGIGKPETIVEWGPKIEDPNDR